MPTLDWILEVLDDGKWHRMSEIVKKSKLADSMLKRIIGFLAEYQLIQRDETLQKVRLTAETLRFLKDLRETEVTSVSTEDTRTRKNCD